MIERGFYSLNKILSLKDKNGEDPQVYFICGNRGPGKTFAVMHYFTKRFLDHGEKFIFLRREVSQLDGVAQAWIKKIQIKFPDYVMSEKSNGRQPYKELWIKKSGEDGAGEMCGYAIAMNGSNKIRELSGIFEDAERIFFDEFQAEDGCYVPKEITKFLSILTSVSRGGGKTYRYVPAFLCSNDVSIVNPYFRAFHVDVDSNTKYARGQGWVYEQVYGAEAAKAIDEGPLGNLMRGSDYGEYAMGGKYLADNTGFIENVSGNRFSVATILCDGETYGVWQIQEGDYAGYMYINHKYNNKEVVRISFSIKDHKPGGLLTLRGSIFVKSIKDMFERGYVFFADQDCKNTFIEMIGLSQINK